MNSRLNPISYRITDRFWSPRLDALRTVTLPGQWRAMEATGRIDNFRRAAGTLVVPHRGFVFNDSDAYKWLEAAARAGYQAPEVDELIDLVRAAQGPDGYLNTAFMFEKEPDRWSNLRDDHELYCAGHLIEAALALARQGDDRLLDTALKFARLICDRFGSESEGKRPGVPGHEEVEIALVALCRHTGERRYLDQARYFLDARGRGLIGGQPYHQDHTPFRGLDKMTGHAVRALYLNIAAADVYMETGEPALLETLVRLWERMNGRQLYITGGLGARRSGEAFGEDYELPNAGAYAETCASLAGILWNERMLRITREARYADALETTLYNAALAGISLAGDAYFYTNPLADEGTHRRAAYFKCACCPPNIARLLAGLPDLVSSAGEGALWLHLYIAGEGRAELGGHDVRFRVETDYPRNGRVRIVLETGGNYGLQLRVPAWAREAALRVNGEDAGRPEAGYAALARDWQAGDQIELEMAMQARWLAAHPAVVENAGRVALVRGPLVYCVELNDPHPETLRIANDGAVEVVERGAWCDLRFEAAVVPEAPSESETSGKNFASLGVTTPVTAVPYFTWANEEPAPMRVWLKILEK